MTTRFAEGDMVSSVRPMGPARAESYTPCVPTSLPAAAERPRERLLERGCAALTDCELLAVMLRTGVKGRPAIDLARDLVTRFGGVGPLLAADARAISQVQGVGAARAAQLTASIELVRRALLEEAARRDALASPDAVRDYLRLSMSQLAHEAFTTLFLDSQNRLIAAREMFRGTLTQTSVYPREIVKAALAHNAAAVVFAHNHPSGVAEPSRADELLTAALKQALALVDIRTLDHFVVAGQRVVSFAERGLL
jgi:DNA repair protein RadC